MRTQASHPHYSLLHAMVRGADREIARVFRVVFDGSSTEALCAVGAGQLSVCWLDYCSTIESDRNRHDLHLLFGAPESQPESAAKSEAAIADSEASTATKADTPAQPDAAVAAAASLGSSCDLPLQQRRQPKVCVGALVAFTFSWRGAGIERRGVSTRAVPTATWIPRVILRDYLCFKGTRHKAGPAWLEHYAQSLDSGEHSTTPAP